MKRIVLPSLFSAAVLCGQIATAPPVLQNGFQPISTMPGGNNTITFSAAGSKTITHSLNTMNLLTKVYPTSANCTADPATASTVTVTCPAAATVSVVAVATSSSSLNIQTAPTITWATPAPIQAGTALSGTQLNATSATPGSFTYNPASGTVINAITVLNTTFTPTDTLTYSNATASVTQAIASRTANLVYYWPCTEGSGTTCAESVSGNTATLTGVTWSSDGTLGSYPLFSGTGTSGALSANNTNGNFSNTQPYTVSIWLKPTATANGNFFSDGVNNGTGYFAYASGGGANFVVIGSNGVALVVTTTATLPVGSWTHFTATTDGTGSCAGTKIYEAPAGGTSTLVSNGCSGGLTATSANSSNGVAFGKNINSSPFNGGTKYARVYGAAISQADDQTIVNNLN